MGYPFGVDDLPGGVRSTGAHLPGAERFAAEAVRLDREGEPSPGHGAGDAHLSGVEAGREGDRLPSADGALARAGPVVGRGQRSVGDARVHGGRGDGGVGLSRVGGGATVRGVDRRAGVGRRVGANPDDVRSVISAGGREGHREDEQRVAVLHRAILLERAPLCRRGWEVLSCRIAEGT